MSVNVNKLRHPKESFYFLIAAIGGGFVWFMLLLSTFGLILIWGLLAAIGLWIAQQMLQAKILGNAIKVTENQFPEIYNAAKDSADKAGMKNLPDVFVVNTDGVINAFAVKLFSRRYTILASSLVDLMYDQNDVRTVQFVMAHEMAHHAAGHTTLWKNLLVKPAMFIPFLGSAYSRACEMTCDAVAAHVVEKEEPCVKALALLALGSVALSDKVSVDAFTGQEAEMPNLFTFINEILSTHPRLTRRILLVKNTLSKNPKSIEELTAA